MKPSDRSGARSTRASFISKLMDRSGRSNHLGLSDHGQHGQAIDFGTPTSDWFRMYAQMVNEGHRTREEQRKLMDQRDLRNKLRRDREYRDKMEQKKKESAMVDKKLYYAGIGSRQTPEYVLDLMEQLACRLREDGFTLRSGHAPGADQAFERGAGAAAQIFLPWTTFEQDVAFSASRDPATGAVNHPKIFDYPAGGTYQIVEKIHPNWEACSDGARKLHARNAHQILGPEISLPTPVEFVICWTPEAQLKGGTATAIKIAQQRNIPVHNLADEDTYDMAFEWAWEPGIHVGGLVHSSDDYSPMDGMP